MKFDGVKGSYVRIGREEDLNVGMEDFTLEAWIYPRIVKSVGSMMIAGKNVSGITDPPGCRLRAGAIPAIRSPQPHVQSPL